MPKVLFIDTTHDILEKELQQMGYETDYLPEMNYDGYANIINEYEGIVIRNKIRIDKSILDKAVNLKFIARAGSGLENIDVDYAHGKGIKCINSPEGNRDSLGEHTVGMLLSLFHRIHLSNNEVKRGIWKREENRGVEIMGKTIGIIGYGNMGGAFARRLAGFGAEVIAYDKYRKDYSDDFVREASMEEIYSETDILSLHVPLTPETKYLVDLNFLENFDKSIYLVNTSRGRVVNTGDLVKALESGKVKGAVLDVIEYESHTFEALNSKDLPVTLRYLMDSDKVLITPHIAGYSIESKFKLAKVLADKIRKEFDL